jgi:23S rRNA (guanine745-N1)-methyltransferase
MFYQCPICALPLTRIDNSWGCAGAHRFDCAKEGYVNLLPVQKKKSKDPGDNQQMMLARRAFLNAGYYQALSDRINELALQWASTAEALLDIGCGEGYYSHRLQQSLSQHHPCRLQGLDISRSAIRYAAKRYPELEFCVASAYDMPFMSASFDLAIRVYAPSRHEELQRVLRPGAVLITVAPGPSHHYALKQLIYAQPRQHPESDARLEGFDCLHQERLRSTLTLVGGEDVGHFLEMTPYAWKLTEEQKHSLALSGLECELDFQIEVHTLARSPRHAS